MANAPVEPMSTMIAHTSVQPFCVIIEDQALIAMSLEAYFEDVGFAVHTLTSIAQAQAWLKNNTPELAILDFMLRDGPATQLAGELHSRGVPFIVYSGYARHLGVPTQLQEVPWLEKPTRREDLLNALVALPPRSTSIAALSPPPSAQN
ncbi:response regulator [Microvirga ossetica]|nr:response regulator [Microvirga ossetica]